ncbi:MAG: LapA family protein [Kamptonema sp. SIO4C4]|nr:LapA family protein [Kamptonema sp. SIO4C4]
MRQLNFLLIFLFCLAIALFCLENTAAVTVRVIPGFEVEAPLAIELLLTLGLGAILAWLFSLWVKLQKQLSTLGDLRDMRSEVKAKEKRIEELQKDLEKYRSEMEQQRQQALPASEEKTEST